jgi:uncharacterized protein
MQSKLLYEEGGKRTFALILQTGDEAMACLQQVAIRELLAASQITAIGGHAQCHARRLRLGVADLPADPRRRASGGCLASRRYRPRPDRTPSVHVHAVLGRRDGTALAGHLQEGYVRPTLEIIVTESPAHLCKVKDEASGLAVISTRECA